MRVPGFTAALASMALLLAGCSTPAATVDAPASPTSDDTLASPPLRTLQASYALHLSEANTAGARTGIPPMIGFPSDNCLGLIAGVRIVQGFANATWTPQTLAAGDLLLALDYGPGDRRLIEGPSKLSLGLSGITTGSVQSVAGTSDGFQGSLLTVNLAGEAGAAADQEVRLDLWLLYEAGEDLVPEAGFTCSPFTLPAPSRPPPG